MNKRLILLTILWTGIVLIAFGVMNCSGSEAIADADGFVGSEACKSCHSNEFDEWQQSHHVHAMEFPSSKSVLGDFSGVSFVADGDSSHFFMIDSTYMVNLKTKSGERKDFPIKYTFGWTPLQQYLVETEGGRLQTLRVTWDSDKNKWFNQFAGQEVPGGEYIHWEGQAMTWNTMCADCHSTNVKKNYDPETHSFTTTYSEVTLGCESCHGPGEAHVKQADAGETIEKGLLAMTTGRDKKEVVNSCAPCHMRRAVFDDFGFGPNHLLDLYLPQSINDLYYEKDGQILEEDYVIGSFLQSKMYHSDVACLDCHNPHTNALKFKGNKLCMQCHTPNYDTPEHTFHRKEDEGGKCINCHMVGKTYMGNDYRRDHSFRIPRPDLSVKHGTTNACTDCHTDMSNETAAEWVEEKYGPNRQINHSDYLTEGSYRDTASLRALYAFFTNPESPEIARVTALEYMSEMQIPGTAELLMKATEDSSAWVVEQALASLMNADKATRYQAAMGKLTHPVRAVRHRAAFLTSDLTQDDVPADYKQAWESAQQEYLDYMRYSADFREGRMQWGQYLMRSGKPDEAIAQYKMAVAIDSGFVVAYHSWASTAASASKPREAKQALKLAMEREQDNDRTFYLLALLLNEEGDGKRAIRAMEQALKLAPGNVNYTYNLALMYDGQGDRGAAKQLVSEAMQASPSNPQLMQLQQYFNTGN